MKKLIYIIICILLASFSTAALTDADSYWTLDNDNTSATSDALNWSDSRTLSNNSITTGQSGILSESYNFDGTSGYISNTAYAAAGRRSISFWVKYDGASSGTVMGWSDNAGSTVDHTRIDITGAGNYNVVLKTGNVLRFDKSCTYPGGTDWAHIVQTYNPAQTFINGTNITACFDSATQLPNANMDELLFGDLWTSGFDVWGGNIDEIAFYDKLLTQSEINDLYNSGAGFNPYATVSTPTINNVSLESTSISLNTFNLTSSNYATISSEIFSCTAGTDFSSTASFYTQKVSGNADNLTLKILRNGTKVFEDKMITLSNNNEFRAVGTDHVYFSCLGTENLTYQMKTDGGSIMEIHDMNLMFTKGESSIGNTVNLTVFNITESLVGSVNQSIFNFSMERLSEDIYLSASTRTTSLVNNLVSMRFIDLDLLSTSPYWERLMASASSIGSSIGTWVDSSSTVGKINYTLNAVNSDSTTSTINGTIMAINLLDSNNNTIQGTSITNTGTNFSNFISISTTLTKILNITYEVQNGTELLLEFQGTISNPSASAKTITYTLNTSTGCVNTSQRTMTANGDYANIPLRTQCNGLTPKQNVTVEVWAISSTPTIRQFDESLSIVEASPFTITTTADSDVPVIAVSYPTVNQSNGTIIGTCTDANVITSLTINDSNFTNEGTFESFKWVFNGSIEENISVQIACTDIGGNVGTFNQTLWVDNVFPVCTGWENKTVFFNQSYAWDVNCVDNNIFSFVIECGSDYTENVTAINLNSYNYTNSTRVPSNLTCTYEVADGHTKKNIKINHNVLFDKQTSVYDNKIRITSNNAVSEWTNKDEGDRVTFELDLIDKADYISFNITSDEHIYIQPDLFIGYVISGDYWIDFENNEKVISHNIDRLESNKVQVNLWFDKEVNKIKFKSIGKLNIITGNFNINQIPDPENKFILKRFSCDVSTTGKSILLSTFVIMMVVLFLAQFYLRIPIFSIIFGFVLGYFAWIVAPCFYLANVLFIIMGILSILYGFIFAFDSKSKF